MKSKTLLLCLALIFSTAPLANPHTIDVELKLAPPNGDGQQRADNLSLFKDGQKIEIIDFPKDKKFIRFTFPEGYSDFDLKVFEKNEVAEKQKIINAYGVSLPKGVMLFNELWPNHASSAQNSREFQVHEQGGRSLVVHNKNVDGTAEGVLHDYILRFTVNGTTYLSDPSIRNKN